MGLDLSLIPPQHHPHFDLLQSDLQTGVWRKLCLILKRSHFRNKMSIYSLSPRMSSTVGYHKCLILIGPLTKYWAEIDNDLRTIKGSWIWLASGIVSLVCIDWGYIDQNMTLPCANFTAPLWCNSHILGFCTSSHSSWLNGTHFVMWLKEYHICNVVTFTGEYFVGFMTLLQKIRGTNFSVL